MSANRSLCTAAALLLATACIRGEQARPDSSETSEGEEAEPASTKTIAQAQQEAADARAKQHAAQAEAERKQAAQAAGREAEAQKLAAQQDARDKAANEQRQHAVVALTSSNPEAVAHFLLGFQWYFAGHESKAVDELQHALSFDEGFLLARSYLFLSSPGADSMAKAVQAAKDGASLGEAERTELEMNAASKSADYAQADELLAKLIYLAPADWRVQMYAGGNAWRTRDLAGALAAYSRAAALNPKAFGPHVMLAAMASLKGDHETELAEVQRAIAALPGEAALQDDLAQAYISAGRLDDAKAALDVEKKMESAGFEVHASMAQLAFLRGQHGLGVTEAEAAVKAAKDESDRLEATSNLALAQLIAGQHAQALETVAREAKEAAGKNPNYLVQALVDRGVIEIDREEPEAAVATFREALEATDKDGLSATARARFRAELLVWTAWANAAAKNAIGAKAAADALASELGEAVETDSENASQLAFARGEAALAAGDAKGGIELLVKCIPDDDLCRWALVAAQANAGDKEAAAASEKAFLATNHTSYLALWARDRLAPPASPAAAAAKKAKGQKGAASKTDLAGKAENSAEKAAGR